MYARDDVTLGGSSVSMSTLRGRALKSSLCLLLLIEKVIGAAAAFRGSSTVTRVLSDDGKVYHTFCEKIVSTFLIMKFP